MDATKHLLRRAVYLFYPPPAAVILETLLHHGVLYEDDLVKLCQLHRKVLRAHAANLLHDKLITVHVQKEDFQGRLFTRTYYYIHFIEAIDAIKWKVHCIVKQMKDDIGALSEPQGYVCPTCHQKYTLLDAASLLSDDGLQFECSLCGDGLVDDDISQEQKRGQEKLERLMALLEPIIKFLKDIDEDVIEDNNFESSLVKAIPAFANSLANYSMVSNQSQLSQKKDSSSAAANAANSYYAPSGPSIHKRNNADAVEAAKRGDATIHVSITADDEDLKRERAKREQRNEKLRQNALPSWHQSSTVGEKELGKLDGEEENDEIKLENNVTPMANVSIPSEVNTKGSENVNIEEMNALSAYYEQLKQRQDKEDIEDEEMWDMDEWQQGVNGLESNSPTVSVGVSATISESTPTGDGSETKVSVKKEESEDNENENEIVEEKDEFDDLDEDDIDLDMFD